MSEPRILLTHPYSTALPVRLTRWSSWHEHIPFAFALMAALEPRTLVELGTRAGDSYCAFCQAVEALSLPTRCHAVATLEGDEHAGRCGADVLEELRAHHDARYGRFSQLLDSTVDGASARFPDGSIDLLHVDGLLTEAAVRSDFDRWRPRLSERAVVLFHDVNARVDGFGAWRFWDEVSRRHPSFTFHHGNGLGVLVVGPEAPPELLALCALPAPGQAAVRDRFSALGSRVGLLAKLAVAEEELRRTRPRLEALVQAESRAAALEQRALGAEALRRRLEEAQEQADELRGRLDAADRATRELAQQVGRMAEALERGRGGPLRGLAAWVRKNNLIRQARRKDRRGELLYGEDPRLSLPAATEVRGHGPIAWLRRLNRSRLARRRGAAGPVAAGAAPSAAAQPAARASGSHPTASSPSARLVFDHRRIRLLATRHTEYVARLLSLHLQRLGYDPSIEFEYLPDADSGFVVICPQMFPVLPKRYVAFQMEQSIHPRWFTPDYLETLRRAEAVFDYSLENLEFLGRQGVPVGNLFFVPIAPHAALRAPGEERAMADRPWDFAFYGDPSAPRRQALLAALSRRYRVQVISEVFGAELVTRLRQARAVVNLHYYEDGLLETTRLAEALSNGLHVLSEGVADEAGAARLWPGVAFFRCGDENDMLARAEELLQRCVEGAAGPPSAPAELDTGHYLERYLVFRGHLPTTHLSPQFYPEAARALEAPRICLSLPETPARRRAFAERNEHGFLLFDGARLSPGWMGCGLSYRTLGRQALSTAARRLVICEDDVVFGEDFGARFQAIERWLSDHEDRWDVFSGLIADLHTEARVIAVDELDGRRLVTINRMTSMVFNVYSRTALGLLASWDEHNRDEANHIDRYLERMERLKVVVAVPFLVGHCEEQHSTIWNFQNSYYKEMIARSEAALREKVERFLAEGGRVNGADPGAS